jgi:phosphate transport system protein
VLGDLPINREIRAIDALCHAFVARHIPSAGHLRFVSSVLQMNVALERIGDYAVTIAREAVQLRQSPPEQLGKDIAELAAQSCEVLRDALLAFSERDAELARKTRPRAKAIEKTYGQVYSDLVNKAATLGLADAFALLAIFNRLERVSDQAKNISEETLFELTGEQKPATQYRVLFVDEDGTHLAPLAAALAEKAFPESGHYFAAGLTKGRPDPGLSIFAERLGLDILSVNTRAWPSDPLELDGVHVVVAMTPAVASKIERLPYSTSLIEWTFASPQAPLDMAGATELSRKLANEVRELMVLMRGPDAP